MLRNSWQLPRLLHELLLVKMGSGASYRVSSGGHKDRTVSGGPEPPSAPPPRFPLLPGASLDLDFTPPPSQPAVPRGTELCPAVRARRTAGTLLRCAWHPGDVPGLRGPLVSSCDYRASGAQNTGPRPSWDTSPTWLSGAAAAARDPAMGFNLRSQLKMSRLAEGDIGSGVGPALATAEVV